MKACISSSRIVITSVAACWVLKLPFWSRYDNYFYCKISCKIHNILKKLSIGTNNFLPFIRLSYCNYINGEVTSFHWISKKYKIIFVWYATFDFSRRHRWWDTMVSRRSLRIAKEIFPWYPVLWYTLLSKISWNIFSTLVGGTLHAIAWQSLKMR